MRRFLRKQNLIAQGVVFTIYISLTFGGNLEPPGPPSCGTMKPLSDVEPRKAVQTLPGSTAAAHIISEPGSYYLTGDISVGRDKHAILIDADHVTLDLSGFRVFGSWGLVAVVNPPASTGNGIHIANGHGNIEIRNGSVISDSRLVRENGPITILRIYQGFRNGVHAHVVDDTWPANIRLIDVRIEHATFCGLYVTGNDHLIEGCSSSNNGSFGISVGDGSRVVNCSASENSSHGVNVGDKCVVRGCIARKNKSAGINALSSCLVAGNTASENRDYGIHAQNGCTLRSNVCSENVTDSESGCGITASGSCVVSGNTLSGNDYGLVASNGCTVIDNVARSNRRNGMRIGAYSVIDRNVAYGNNTSGGGYANMTWTAPVKLGLNQY